MQYAVFDNILIDTFSGRINLILFIMALLFILTFVRVIYYLITKDNRGFSAIDYLLGRTNRKAKLSTKQQISKNISILVLLLAYCLYSMYPVYQDVHNHQYVQIHGQYKRTEISSESNLFSNGYVYVYKDGNRLDLVLPGNWSEDEYPLGEYSGTIWYSKATKVILSLNID